MYESIVLYMCEGKVLMDITILINSFVLISNKHTLYLMNHDGD